MKITVCKTFESRDAYHERTKLFASIRTSVSAPVDVQSGFFRSACRSDECSYGSNGRACRELMSTRSSALIWTAASVANDASAVAAAAAAAEVRCIFNVA